MLRLAEIFFYRLSSSVFAILFVLDPARSEMRANLYGQKGPKGVVSAKRIDKNLGDHRDASGVKE